MMDKDDFSVTDETKTDLGLITAARNPLNRTACKFFHCRYFPFVVACARRLGLDANDAEDVGQETLMEFYKSFPKETFNIGKGGFRRWLFTVTRSKVADIHRKRTRELSFAEIDPELMPAEPVDPWERIWEEEWQKWVIQVCHAQLAREVRSEVFTAFDLYVVERRSAEEVARLVNLNVNEVYLIKSRMLKRMRELRKSIEEIW